MKRFSQLLAVLIVLGLCFRIEAQTLTNSFVSNGSFEFGGTNSLFGCNPFDYPNCSGTGNYPTSGDRLPGWLAYNDSNSDGGFVGLVTSPLALEGDRMLLMTYGGSINRSPAKGYIESVDDLTIPLLTLGQSYELSFWASAAQPDRIWNEVPWTSRVGAQVRGALGEGLPTYHVEQTYILPEFSGSADLTTRSNPLDWQHYTLDFVALSETVNVSFLAGGYERIPLGSSVYLDNVSLSVIPEPSGAMLVLVAGIMLRFRRRVHDRL